MKIGVLGSGTVGQVLASGFLKHGHQVMLGTRDPQKVDVQKWLKKNSGGQIGTFAEAAKFADLAVLAVLGRVAIDVLKLAGPENLAGKTVIDTTNPIAETPPVDGVLAFTTGPNESLGEQIQAYASQIHVVKAFNSVGAAKMVDPHYEQGTPRCFFAAITPRPRHKCQGYSNSLDGSPSIAEASSPPARLSRSACSGASPVFSGICGPTRSRY